MTTPAAFGGEGGIKSLTSDEPLRGLAALCQKEVEAELDQDGRAAIVRRAAIRLEAVSRLFYGAILAAVDRQDFDKLALYAQRFAWLEARALSAWAQVRDEEKPGRGGRNRTVDYEKLVETKQHGGDSGD